MCTVLLPPGVNSIAVRKYIIYHTIIPVSSYTLFVLRPLADTTQFQFYLTHCLCCVLWPTQHTSNFILHTVCVPSFNRHNNSNFIYTLFVLCPLANTTQHNSNFFLHTVCVASFDQHNTIPISSTHCLCCALWPTQHNTIPVTSYTLFVLRPLTNTTQFQFHLHTVCVAPFNQHNTIPISSTHCLLCALWPTQHNSSFIYTLFVLRLLTDTTQFQFYLHTVCVASFDQHSTIPISSTHCLCCALWTTQHNSNFIYTLFLLRPLTDTTQFQFLLTHCLWCAL
jgi:hypothetical protein